MVMRRTPPYCGNRRGGVCGRAWLFILRNDFSYATLQLCGTVLQVYSRITLACAWARRTYLPIFLFIS